MSLSCIFKKKNTDPVKRNGESNETKTVIRYASQVGPAGADGAPSFLAYITPQSHTISAGPMYATDGQPDRIINVLVFRGGVQIPAKIGTITGLPSGITITPQSNNTTEAHLLVHVTSTLSEDGSVNIPISYNADVTDTADPNFWDASVYDIETTTSVYSWTLAKSSTSLWVLDLTNETAKINADSSGNIDASAYRPECQARLAFGSNNELEGVYYSVSTGDASVQGVGVDHSTGELILDYNNVPFQFGDLDNTILEIRFDASYEGTVRGSKVMTIEKSLPGQSGPAGSTPYIGQDGYWYIDGQSLGVKAEGENGTTPHIGPNGNWWLGSQDTGVKAEGTEGAAAVTRWIVLSADQVKVDASSNVIPDKIYATAYKQTGGETPTTDSSTVIKWAHDSSTTSTVYTTSGVSVTSTWNYLTFKLYDEDGSTYLGESETVPVLRDGKNGEPGAVGPRGAIIRGPVEWDPSVVRRYCSGEQNGSDSQYHPEDASYIDIVLKDSSLYQCIKSFTQNSGDAWKGSTYWQLADNECNFIATKLLLAKNAKIDFLTGNELYLTDANGNISGGGRAAGNGSDVVFWAGSDASAGNINNAQFQVKYDGTMTATKGQFGCLTIGHDTSRDIDRLEGSVTTADGSTGSVEVSPCYIVLDSSTEHRRASITVDDVDNRYEGIIDVSCGSDEFAFWSDNGIVKAGSLEVTRCETPTNVVLNNSGHAPYFSKAAQGGGAVVTPGLFGLEIVFISSPSNFDATGPTWKFCGFDLGISTTDYPEVMGDNLRYNPQGYISRTDSDSKYNGYWGFKKDYNSTTTDYIITGIAVKTISEQGSIITKLPNVLYITL